MMNSDFRRSCLNCQKNAVVCEGYPPKEIWKSGKQKLEDGKDHRSLLFRPLSFYPLIYRTHIRRLRLPF